MSKATLAILGATLALASLTTSGAAAQAGSTSAATVASDDTVGHLTFIDKAGPFKDIDVPPTGPSLGDSNVFSETVTKNGKNVGLAGGICTTIKVTTKAGRVATVTQQCVVTASLPKGQLTFQGIATFSTTGPGTTPRFAITGGTGAYRTARGDITVSQLSNPNQTKVSLTLITG
jgi:hypothetical protein